jgi:anthranilate phosphoribosyltransferase
MRIVPHGQSPQAASLAPPPEGPMSIAPYIKEIGRGKDGARPLSAEQAYDLFSQVLDGQASDVQIGAFCVAMRIKGEAIEELEGFVQATQARCLPLPQAAAAARTHAVGGIVVLPSYNGARKLPNLTALLAAVLARRGLSVLVHGSTTDPTRVTSAQVFAAAQLPVVQTDAELARAWQAGKPAFMAIDILCAPLARLLAVRWDIGLRNPGHTVAKLIDPFLNHPEQSAPSVRVVNHTHPEYAHSLTGYLQHSRAHALLMRGTEGEPVADARRQPRFDVFIGGEPDANLSRAPVEGVLTKLPDLPAGFEADVTARYIQAVLAGEQPLPDAIDAQASCLIQALARAGSADAAD